MRWPTMRCGGTTTALAKRVPKYYRLSQRCSAGLITSQIVFWPGSCLLNFVHSILRPLYMPAQVCRVMLPHMLHARDAACCVCSRLGCIGWSGCFLIVSLPGVQMTEEEKRDELLTKPSDARERLRKTRDMDSTTNGPQLGDGLASTTPATSIHCPDNELEVFSCRPCLSLYICFAMCCCPPGLGVDSGWYIGLAQVVRQGPALATVD